MGYSDSKNGNRSANGGREGEDTEKKDTGTVVVGTVIESLPGTLFRIALPEGAPSLLAYLAGRMRINRIRVLVGDRVEILLDKYGGRGRIIRRL